jgi:hypothetical protein
MHAELLIRRLRSGFDNRYISHQSTQAARDSAAERMPPPNFTLKPLRPGFGPAEQNLLGVMQVADRVLRLRACSRQPACRSGFGKWALAAQLSVCAVRRTRGSSREREGCRRDSVLASATAERRSRR